MLPTGVAALAFVAGCVETRSGPRAPSATPSRSRAAQTAPYREAPVYPEVEDLALSADRAAAAVKRLAVPRPVAERFARGFARHKDYLKPPLSTCLALPEEDRDGHHLAWHFILAHGVRCDEPQALLSQARAVALEAGGAPGAPLDVVRLKRAMELSAERFATIKVAAHTFRHPLVEAHRGLPSWVLSAALGEVPLPTERCTPDAVLVPAAAGGHRYVVRYTCGQRTLIYSHARRRVVGAEAVAASPPSLTFERWQAVINAKYGAAAGDHLVDHRRLWERHLTDASTSGGAR